MDPTLIECDKKWTYGEKSGKLNKRRSTVGKLEQKD